MAPGIRRGSLTSLSSPISPANMPCEDCLSRREFLTRSTAAVAGAAALAAGCGDGQFGPTALRQARGTVSIKTATLPGLSTTGQVVKLPADLTDAGGFPVLIAVKRTGPASFAAVSTVCTHQQCEVNILGNAFVCPCHDARYDSDGRVTAQPVRTSGSATDLPVYTTKYDAATDTLTIS